MDNLETVQEIYAAFGRGDVPFILDQIADDVEWEYGSTTDVPWLQLRKGRDGVGGFFEALGSGVEITKFVPHTFLDGGDVVLAMIDIEATARNTGATIVENDEVHIWRFDSAGKVQRFAHKVDTHMHWRVHHGE